VEGEHIVSGTNNTELVELPVLESGGDRGYNVAVPENVNECISFEGRPTECTGLEKRDGVLLASYRSQWRSGSERSGESIVSISRAEEGNSVARVSVWLEEEYGGIEKTASRAGTNPINVGTFEAKETALVKALETTVDHKVLALVATGEGDLKASLAGVHSGGRIGDDKVLDTCSEELE
jgi:hypothetical protein